MALSYLRCIQTAPITASTTYVHFFGPGLRLPSGLAVV
jgi:hypothetical protein